MTLNITMVSTWGVWRSCDHRLLSTDGKLVDDEAVKQVVLQCPDGTAIVTYAGIGMVGGGAFERNHISDWIRSLLRGETRTIDQSLLLIREEASKSLAPIAMREKIEHVFSVGAFLRQPWAALITNRTAGTTVGPRFETTAAKASTGNSFVMIAGAGRLGVSAADQKLLKKLAHQKPRTPTDYVSLLAEMNRRASKSNAGTSVSPGCLVSYIPPEEHGAQSTAFTPDGHAQKVNPVIPYVLFGVDTTDMQGWLHNVDFGDSRTPPRLPQQSDPAKAVTPDRRLLKKK